MIRIQIRNPIRRKEVVVVKRKGVWYEVEPVRVDLPTVGMVDIPGGKVELFTVKTLAETMDRLGPTVRDWEKLGVFPRALYQRPATNGKGNIRLYAAWQLVAINQVYIAMGGKRRGLTHPACTFSLDLFLERARTVFYRKDAHIDPATGEVVVQDGGQGGREAAESTSTTGGAIGLRTV